MPELVVDRVTVTVERRTLLDNISLILRPGEVVALIGPNGAGKSTLLRAIAGVIAASGTITIDDMPVAALGHRTRARLLAWLPQTPPPAWPVRVRDAVALGRFAWGNAPDMLDARNAAAIDQALARCDIAPLANRRVTTLSGGELARVHIARLLCTEAPILLADEPTASLDPAHQLDVMALLADEAARGGAVLVVVHDIALAARFATRIIALRNGRVIADASPENVTAPPMMARIFDVAVDMRNIDGRPVPLPVARVSRAAEPPAASDHPE